MKDFVVLCKPLKFNQLSADKFSADSIQLAFLLQQTYKDHQHIRDYEIDKDSIRFETIDNRLCVILLAFRK